MASRDALIACLTGDDCYFDEPTDEMTPSIVAVEAKPLPSASGTAVSVKCRCPSRAQSAPYRR